MFVLTDLGYIFGETNVKQERKREKLQHFAPILCQTLSYLGPNRNVYGKFISQQNDIISMLHFEYN